MKRKGDLERRVRELEKAQRRQAERQAQREIYERINRAREAARRELERRGRG